MAHHHHKSNKAVEGDPYSGHSRGMPERPDDEELRERAEEDREEVGLPPEPPGPAAGADRENP
ncbi:hypothetical protein [Actinacidiphila paucisporea]|uniref:Uncharacterized protein n=1 Tax=Actinacidiphila paucisporea TaxID=310782 RepID=A0A1M7NFC5_9ACTN|nr:hypothetical protein [Actinacidiphila paucisporea]SHN02385.1 hypothetical protein SAMN05216499_118107 [Actinacidiphila paucisporea]